MGKFAKILTIEEFHKLSPQDQEAYAQWSSEVDRINARDRQLEETQKENAEIAKAQKEYDESPAVKDQIAKEHADKANEEAYRKQEEAQDGTLVAKSMAGLIDYAMLQDVEIKGLRKDVSEVAAMKGEVATLKKELAEAKQLEKERIQKERASINERVFLHKEMEEPRRRYIPPIPKELL